MKDKKIKLKQEQLIELTSKFCDDNLSDDYKEQCIKLIEKLGRKHNVPFKRGKLEIWFGGIIYVIARENFLFDISNPYYLTGDLICDYFNTKKSTVRKKADLIEDLVNIASVHPSFAVENPFEDEYNDYKENVVFDIRQTPETFLNKYSTNYSLDNAILYGKDEPTECMDVDMYNILSKLKNNPI